MEEKQKEKKKNVLGEAVLVHVVLKKIKTHDFIQLQAAGNLIHFCWITILQPSKRSRCFSLTLFQNHKPLSLSLSAPLSLSSITPRTLPRPPPQPLLPCPPDLLPRSSASICSSIRSLSNLCILNPNSLSPFPTFLFKLGSSFKAIIVF